MARRTTGRHERGEDIAAFIPEPLPPSKSPARSDELRARLREAEQALLR